MGGWTGKDTIMTYLDYVNLRQGTDSSRRYSRGNTLPLTHQPSPWIADYGAIVLQGEPSAVWYREGSMKEKQARKHI